MTNDSNRKSYRISYYGPIKSIVHKSEESLSEESLSEPTMNGVLKALGRKYGPEFQELVFHDKEINRAVNIFVNGVCLTQRNDFERKLEFDSEIEIVLISQAAGG